jgi:hypothetical protein
MRICNRVQRSMIAIGHAMPRLSAALLVTRPDPSTFARDTKDERKRGLGDHRKTKSSTNVFDVTRDLVIRHHTDLDLIECLVVMKSGIPVTGEAATHDRAEDVDVAC